MKQNGVRLVQRKFAQGVPIPASSASVAPVPPERKPDPPCPPKNVYHNNMSARSLLDIVSMQNIHKHNQEPLVVLERLRADEIPPPLPTAAGPGRSRPGLRVPLRRRKVANGNMCLRSGKRKAVDVAKVPIKKRKKLSSESKDDLPLVYYFNNRPAKSHHSPLRPKPVTDKKTKLAEREKRTPTTKRSERSETTVSEKSTSRTESRASDDCSFTFKEPTSPARLSYRLYKKKAAATAARQLKKAVVKEARWSSLRSARSSSETRSIVRRVRSKVLLGKKLPKPAVKKTSPKAPKDSKPASPPGPSGFRVPRPPASESSYAPSEQDSLDSFRLSCVAPNSKPGPSGNKETSRPSTETYSKPASPPGPSGFRVPRPPASESSYAPSEQDSLDSFRLSCVAPNSKPGPSGNKETRRPSTETCALQTNSRRASLESITRFLACKDQITWDSWTAGTPEAPAPSPVVPPSPVPSFESLAQEDWCIPPSVGAHTSESDYSDIIKLGNPPASQVEAQLETNLDLERKLLNEHIDLGVDVITLQHVDEKTELARQDNRNVKDSSKNVKDSNKNVKDSNKNVKDRNVNDNDLNRNDKDDDVNKKKKSQVNKDTGKVDKDKKCDEARQATEDDKTKRVKGKGVGKKTVPKDDNAKKPTKAAPKVKEPKKTLPKRAAKAATPVEEASTSTRTLRNSREPPPPSNPDVYEFDAELETSRPPSGLRRRDPGTPTPAATQPNAADTIQYMDILPASLHCVKITPKKDQEEGKEVLSVSLVPKNDIYKKQKNLIDNLTNSPALLNKLFNCLPTELQDELGNLAPVDGREAYLEEKAGSVLEAPTFYPTAEEFQDPIKYYDKIAPEASKYGLCKIVPPSDFNPVCTMSDTIRFAVIYQYISKMYSRWGPVSRELAAIKAHLRTQSVVFARSPLLDGSEVNLPKLYHAVERNGGLSNVIQRKRWGRVADEMKLSKLQHPERKLDPIYMRYLLPYATLSDQERQGIMAEVEKCWTTKYQKMLERARNPFQRQNRMLGAECESESDDDAEDDTAGALHEAEDCIVQGRTMNLITFRKIATSLMDAHFEPSKQPPGAIDVEKAYWRAVLLGTDHIVANTASIDTGEEGYGFPKDPQADYGTHPWNLKVLARNPNNVLRYLGPVLGVTVPTLHLSMLFSTSCWHRDPHGLPWTEYLHSGAEKIWYGIPRDESANFRRAVETLCPAYCQNKSIWLASEITMVPPNILSEHGVKLSRVLQRPGEYVMVFPEAHSCSITTGFGISESVYFASNSWLADVYKLFQELRNSCEPTMFSLEQLLLNGSAEPAAPPRVSAVLATLVAAELEHRRALEQRGLKVQERPAPSAPLNTSYFRAWNTRAQDECEYCRSTLFLSKVTGLTGRKSAVCPEHAIRLLETKKYKNVDLQSIEFLSSYSTLALEEMAERLDVSAGRSRASSVIDLTEPDAAD